MQRVARSLYRELAGTGLRRVPRPVRGRLAAPGGLGARQPGGPGPRGGRGARWPLGARLRGHLRRLRRRPPPLARGPGRGRRSARGDPRAGDLLARGGGRPSGLFSAHPRARASRSSTMRSPFSSRNSPRRATVARFPAYLRELLLFDGVAAVSEDSRLSRWPTTGSWLGVPKTPVVAAVTLGIDPPPPGGRRGPGGGHPRRALRREHRGEEEPRRAPGRVRVPLVRRRALPASPRRPGESGDRGRQPWRGSALSCPPGRPAALRGAAPRRRAGSRLRARARSRSIPPSPRASGSRSPRASPAASPASAGRRARWARSRGGGGCLGPGRRERAPRSPPPSGAC